MLGHRDRLRAAQVPVAPIGAAEGDRLDVWRAIRSHPILFLLPIIVCVAAGVVYALNQPRVYSAQTRLGIVRVDVSAPGALAGFATAGSALAETYSRTVKAEGVLTPLSRRLRTSPADLRTRLSAAAIPSTPVFRITATGARPRGAIALANSAGTSLIAYIENLNRSDPDAARLFRSITLWERRLTQRSADRNSARADYVARKTPLRRARLIEADAAVGAATDQLNALRSAYRQAIGSLSSTSLLQVVDKATTASSDRNRKMQLYGFAGLVVGAVIGSLLALLAAAWSRRRARSV